MLKKNKKYKNIKMRGIGKEGKREKERERGIPRK